MVELHHRSTERNAQILYRGTGVARPKGRDLSHGCSEMSLEELDRELVRLLRGVRVLTVRDPAARTLVGDHVVVLPVGARLVEPVVGAGIDRHREVPPDLLG
jgi:hypothetical protein